jgi:choline-sulfatase
MVYTSDHGEMLGEHGIWEKVQFYEGAVRVPLIIRWPKRFAKPRVVTSNVSLCDLFATLCECSGVPAPPNLDSRSLIPLIEGTAADWEDEVVSQYGDDRVMIKWGALKYQYYGDLGPEVLFNLEQDPGETTDVIGDPAYASVLSRFRARLAALGHGPKADRAYVNAGYGAG